MDLSNWMGNLPRALHDVPLTWLAIPGSHDSFSYTIKPDSEIGPDERRLQCFEHCLCFSKEVKRVIFRWSVTQSSTCTDQLMGGIRYFDFRLAAKLGTLTPFIIHGMYGSSALDILKEIHDFLLGHRSEIVLLDFQHFYNFTAEMHSHTLAEAKRIFGPMLCPYKSPKQRDLRLKTLWQQKYQVIIFYRNDYAEKSQYLWPGAFIPNPWPNTCSVTELIKQLDQEYQIERNPDIFFVTQGILTPDFTYIFFHLLSNLKKSLAPKATEALLEWISNKPAGKRGINIVITDFVGTQPFHFAASVISLNFKLAQSLEKRRT